MREIKFRGKRKDNDKWVYGDLLTYKHIEFKYGQGRLVNDYCIYIDDIIDGEYDVDKNTIGQYTGLKDKNGVEIYEGDIVKASRGYLGEIDFESFICAKQQGAISDDIEVIGNIYDNPELLF